MSMAMSKVGRWWLKAHFGILVLLLYVPMVLLVIFSFNDSIMPAFPLDGFTLRWYRAFLVNPELTASLRTSAIVAGLSSVATMVLALLASYALVRRTFVGKGAVYSLVLLPLVIPYGVFGISLIILFHTIGMPLSILTVVIGHVVLSLPFLVLVLVPRLQRISIDLEEAARDLGANGFATFLRVTLPLMLPALVSGFLIAFTISFDEYVVASFVIGTETTFPIYIVSQLRFPTRLPQALAASVALILASLAVGVLALAVRRVLERRLEGVEAAPVPTEVV